MTDPFNRDPSARYGYAEEIALPDIRLRRITCNNPSPMTFTGTQTYLLGEGDDLAVIDPGPEDPAHLAAILAATEGRIGRILITHTHNDHSAGAAALARATGAKTYGFGVHGTGMSALMQGLVAEGDLGGGEGGDRIFRPDRLLADGDRIAGRGWVLEVLHTPGHLSNHVSFAVEGAGGRFHRRYGDGLGHHPGLAARRGHGGLYGHTGSIGGARG
ncbi:MAG: MBL fold metallo-hydrolase [Pseudomonadota bacterium]